MFSFGAIAYQILLGKSPQIQDPEFKISLEKFPQNLSNTIEKCLEFDPSNRFRDAIECFWAFNDAVQRDVNLGLLQPPRIYTELVFSACISLVSGGEDRFGKLAASALSISQESGQCIDLSNYLTREAVRTLLMSEENGTLVNMIETYQSKIVEENQSWSYADNIAKLYGTILEEIFAMPPWVHTPTTTSGLAFEIFLSRNLLVEATDKARFDAARSFLRSFSSATPLALDTLSDALEFCPSGRHFLKNEVDYRWCNLPETIEELI